MLHETTAVVSELHGANILYGYIEHCHRGGRSFGKFSGSTAMSEVQPYVCQRNTAYFDYCIMEWFFIAFISMMVGVTAHHLGLTEEAAKITDKIAGCPKCCSFWIALFVLLFNGCNLFVAVALALLVAYLSFYFGLILMLLQRLYNWLWQKVNQEQ